MGLHNWTKHHMHEYSTDINYKIIKAKYKELVYIFQTVKTDFTLLTFAFEDK